MQLMNIKMYKSIIKETIKVGSKITNAIKEKKRLLNFSALNHKFTQSIQSLKN